MFGSTHLIQDTVLAALKFFSVCNPCPEDVLPHVTLLLCIMLVQWCTILSVSGHRSIKPTGIRTLVRSRYSSGGLVSHFFFTMLRTSTAAIAFPPTSSLRSVQNTCRRVDKCIWSTGAPCFGWSERPCIAQSKCIMFCRHHSWTKSKFMIRNQSTATVPVWNQSVNFKISCFVHNHGFFLLQVWCPTVFAWSGRCPNSYQIWSPGHFVL